MHYTLDKYGAAVKQQDVNEWATWFSNADRKLAHTKITNSVHVSTVFLGLEHGKDKHGNPLLWETMVFGYVCEIMYRYASEKEALRGHRHVTHYIRKVLANDIRVELALNGRTYKRIVDLTDTNLPQSTVDKVLTEQGELLQARFEETNGSLWGRGCTCHLGHPPCAWCTDPGNPLNLAEDESMWREKTEEEKILERVKRSIVLED